MKNNEPTIIGTGLVALDAVVTQASGETPRLWAGGTCGNVLAILSFLGWKAYPVARLNGDAASREIRDDLARWGVQLDFVDSEPHFSAPIIIQYLRRNAAGQPVHSFSWTCPVCSANLPRFRPVHASAARSIASKLGTPQAFFLDRVSRGSLMLAQASRDRGAVVVFEPSSIGDPALFAEALSMAHIVKYSYDRLGSHAELIIDSAALLTIETRGRRGLRYFSRLPRATASHWAEMPAFEMAGDDLRDTAGAGDWTTAGLVHQIAAGGLHGMQDIERDQLEDALSYSQALAAWSCFFEGARGAMYSSDLDLVHASISLILDGRLDELKVPRKPLGQGRELQAICPMCSHK